MSTALPQSATKSVHFQSLDHGSTGLGNAIKIIKRKEFSRIRNGKASKTSIRLKRQNRRPKDEHILIF